ncbi:RNA-directed DNA polymerase from mobile element jockey-like [Brachionus plicatilis]|uniref:RNA-directed DNA polymerase from mobile element jockey-like n=1 Tax=Brachionus plicatilis TaxID=10195 RepID=A0A3M7SC37_BRAPC|nr:RNA-directed DNA polymerase from mobile element jockey-like [Brachionus plicatilis]
MKISVEKSCSVVFSRYKKKSDNLNLKIYGNRMVSQKEIKFLGIKFDSKLNFNILVDEIKERCNNRLNIIKILSNKKWGLNQNTLGNLYKSLVGSILDYSFPCSNSFSENNIKKLQAIQNTAVRSILKLIYDTPSNIVHHEAFNKLKLLTVSNRLFELSERYVGTGLSHSVPLVERLVKEYKEGFESRYIEYPTPLQEEERKRKGRGKEEERKRKGRGKEEDEEEEEEEERKKQLAYYLISSKKTTKNLPKIEKNGPKKVSDQQGWQILGLLKDRTKTEREIAVLVGVSQKCVNTTRRNFQATSRVRNFGNCGRRPKLSNRDVSYIFRLVRKNPTACFRQIAADFNSKFKEHKISGETVRRVLAKKGIESCSAVKKPLLTVSDMTKRYKWCKERRNWTDKDWAKVIFSDESNFEMLNRKSRVFVK